jgi:A/G-specific adenine glycosylase
MMDIGEFQKIIYSNYEEAGRNFPWRDRLSPWGVMLSEFMLQQTQTERVIPYWNRWMELWPAPEDLAEASLEQVLREWSGLGYNRRARYIKGCADVIVKRYRGQVPDTPQALRSLPGIGPYTAGAIACFAYDYPALFIETNIRATVIHFFFQDADSVRDNEIFPILEAALDQGNPRKWYWALMDYGAALKKITLNPNRKSAHYAKQSRFEGSFRQQRGKIIKSLVFLGPASVGDLAQRTGIAEDTIYQVVESLERELMVAEAGGVYKVSELKNS